MFDLAPIMSWIEAGARGSIGDMKAAVARITDARPNPKVRISQWNPSGKPLPPPNHTGQARADVLHTIMVPAMLINGRVDEMLSIYTNDPVFYYGDDWGVRFLVSSGAMDKAYALYRRNTQNTQRTSGRFQLRALITGLEFAGNYEELDALRREDERREQSPASVALAWGMIDRIRPVHEALRRGDADTVEKDVRSLEDDATKTDGLRVKSLNELMLLRSALLAFHLRRGDWLRAEAQLKSATRLYGHAAHEAWLAGAGVARKAKEREVAERWKAEAKSRFCASNPNHQDPKMGGVRSEVLRFLHLLYIHTASEEGLLPAEFAWQPAWF